MTVPAAVKLAGSADLARGMAGVCVAVIVTVDWAVTPGPLGGGPVAVPVLGRLPASTSAWVVVYVAVHVSLAAGTSEAAPQMIVDSPGIGSATVTGLRVT